MKQPIIAAMRTLTSAYILSMLLWHGSSASEHTTPDDQLQPLVYNPEATAKLQKLFNPCNYFNYTENRDVFRQLVEQDHADPNINKHGFSLLCNATQKNDAPLVASLLTHRADPNPPGDDKPIFTAKSTEVAQLLVNAKADIHALKRSRENALHTAYDASAGVIAVLCNAGVNLHLKDRMLRTPLQRLLASNYATGDRIAPFLWMNTNFAKEENYEIGHITMRSPGKAETFKALRTIVPQVKAKKTAGHEQTKKSLTLYLNQDIMPSVMSYTGQLPGHLYDVRYFKEDIEPHMLAMIAAEERINRSYKRIDFTKKTLS
ncbi:hypothetical protein JST99_04285 [Candidatus Dependentiae bacterium]|nr:hypothetical protein [Candidatus Dependentiae bacterium]MCC7415424.1 hypothetical protein [Campylobacterota bacterium]